MATPAAGKEGSAVKKLLRRLALIFALFVVATVGAYYGVQRTTAFAMARANVVGLAGSRDLGNPVIARLRPFGYAMRVSDSSGTAEFAVDLTGPRGKAIAYVRLKKELGQWSILDSRVTRAGP
jgi:hypothetical protein